MKFPLLTKFNLLCSGRHIYLEDLLRFMEEVEALKTMSLFEGASESRRISKTSLKNWVVSVSCQVLYWTELLRKQ